MKQAPPAPAREPRGAGAVRIIGGRWRNTRLPVVDVPGLRPTADRARETLFNWLQADLADARVLDLFAGSGALGLEALSRGAREALLVERDPAACESLQASIDRLDARAIATVARADAAAFLRLPVHGRFDIVFVDPPFADGLWPTVLSGLSPWVADDACLYVESPADGTPVEPGTGWRLHREGRTRDARHALYRRLPGGAATLRAPSTDPSSIRL